jgi:transcriptional regulator with XRE-family HTH domain
MLYLSGFKQNGVDMTQQEIVGHLSKQLKHYLLDQGISVNEFAKQQGKTRQTISLYLNGKVSIDSLVEMLDGLGCEINVLVRR